MGYQEKKSGGSTAKRGSPSPKTKSVPNEYDINHNMGMTPGGRTTRYDEGLVDPIMNQDSWVSFLSYVGTNRDKAKSYHYEYAQPITDRELDNMYTGDGLSGKIVDAKADDMTRQWINLEPEDDADEKTIQAYKYVKTVLSKLKAKTQFNQALKWKRLKGGAVIIIGVNDGKTLEQPLNVKPGAKVYSLKVIDRTDIDLSNCQFETDPIKEDFGQIKIYSIWVQAGTIRQEIKVHSSRVIAFYGRRVPTGADAIWNYEARFWGVSELQHTYQNNRDLGQVMSIMVSIINELTIGKMTLSNLAELLAENKDEKIHKRIDIMNMSKSILRAVLLGKDESYERDTVNLGGVSDVIDRLMMCVAGYTGYPMTRLFSRSPAGLNATGASDEANYYDEVKSEQTTDLEPQLQTLIDLILSLSKYAEIIIPVEFCPLKQLTAKELADVKKTEAEADKLKWETYQIKADLGVMDAVSIAEEEGYELPEMPEPPEIPEDALDNPTGTEPEVE